LYELPKSLDVAVVAKVGKEHAAHGTDRSIP